MQPFGKKAHDFIMREPKYDKKYTIADGSVRSSKTFMVDAKTIVQYSRYEVGGKRFIAGVSKDSIMRNMLLDLFAIAGKDNYAYNMASGELWLFGKQYFVVGAKDEAAYKKILGSTIGLFIGDEIVEFPKSFLAQVWLRMSTPGARFMGTTNPGNPYAYLKAEVMDIFPPDKLEVLHFNLDDNPNITAEDKADIVASQTGVYKQRYIDGLWVMAEGSIYKDAWDDKLNTFDAVPPALAAKMAARGLVEKWYAVDAGVDHVQAHGEFVDDGDTVYMLREQCWDSKAEHRQKTDGQYADDLEEFGAIGHQVIVPPEAASLKAELSMRGFWVTDADNAVTQGIHTVATLLTRRKLKISRTGCPRTAKRLPAYAWDSQAAKRGVEEPLKKDDDECDMVRYAVHGKIPQWRISGMGG